MYLLLSRAALVLRSHFTQSIGRLLTCPESFAPRVRFFSTVLIRRFGTCCVIFFAFAPRSPGADGEEAQRTSTNGSVTAIGIDPHSKERIQKTRAKAVTVQKDASPLLWALPHSLADMQVACGQNSLYALLLLHGIPVTLQQVKEAVPVANDGASLLALKRGADQFGLSAAIRELPTEGITSALPCIARMKTPGLSDHFHFVVVVRADANEVKLIDGSSGGLEPKTRSSFDNAFSGVALTAAMSTSASRYTTPTICIAALCGVEIIWIVRNMLLATKRAKS